jgi:hypothetical protein
VVDDIAIVHSQLKVFVFLHFPADKCYKRSLLLRNCKAGEGAFVFWIHLSCLVTEEACARVPHGPTSTIFAACLRDLIAM